MSKKQGTTRREFLRRAGAMATAALAAPLVIPSCLCCEEEHRIPDDDRRLATRHSPAVPVCRERPCDLPVGHPECRQGSVKIRSLFSIKTSRFRIIRNIFSIT